MSYKMYENIWDETLKTIWLRTGVQMVVNCHSPLVLSYHIFDLSFNNDREYQTIATIQV